MTTLFAALVQLPSFSQGSREQRFQPAVYRLSTTLSKSVVLQTTISVEAFNSMKRTLPEPYDQNYPQIRENSVVATGSSLRHKSAPMKKFF
jgi:hypothetical protein